MSKKKTRRFGDEGQTRDAQVLWSLAVAVGVAVLAVMSLVSPGSVGSVANGRPALNRAVAETATSQLLPE